MTRLFKIGEVANLLGVNTSAIRFWETKFSFLHRIRDSGKHRYYSEAEVGELRRICNMLKQKHYKIAGVQMAMRQDLAPSDNSGEDLSVKHNINIVNIVHNLTNLRDYINLIRNRVNDL